MTERQLLEKLEAYREKQNLDVSTFAKQISLSPATYYAWRKGAPPKAMEVVVSLINMWNSFQ